jgi:DNA-directed RNA polymerase subunit RPC12/RpoP
MKCQKCGSENKDKDLICTTCGEALKVFCKLCKNYTFGSRIHCEYCGFKVEKEEK